MLLGFKRRFVPFVLDGSKTHTIRGERKNPPSVGQRCDCYVDPRQKTMRLLGRFRCVKVEVIEIFELRNGTFGIRIEGVDLSPEERNLLAWRDGFRDHGIDGAFVSMMQFWMTTHGNNNRTELFRFSGHIIHWDPRVQVPIPSRKTKTAVVNWGMN